MTLPTVHQTPKAPTQNWWGRLNRFSRSAQVDLRLVPLSGDPDTVRITLAGKTIGTINRRPHDWFEVVSLEGKGARATCSCADVDGFLSYAALGESLTKHLQAYTALGEFYWLND